MGDEMSDSDRIMEAELSARSARERKQSSTGPAAVGAAPSGDAANLEFVARRHEELLRLREEGEEDGTVNVSDKCFCFFYPSTLNSKLIIHFLRHLTPQCSC
jgi:hypothetical protein